MTIQIVFETHSTTEDNENGIATGWLPGRDRKPAWERKPSCERKPASASSAGDSAERA